MHDAAGAVHTPLTHTSPASQSPVVLHSTQTPTVTLHTSPGHMRDELQAVVGAHSPAIHVVPSAQSAARTHVDSIVVPHPETPRARDEATAIQPAFVIG